MSITLTIDGNTVSEIQDQLTQLLMGAGGFGTLGTIETTGSETEYNTTSDTRTMGDTGEQPVEPTKPKRRAKAEIEAARAAEEAMLKEAKAGISTGTERVEQDSAETEKQDAADEAAETAAEQTDAGPALTLDDIRKATSPYSTKYGMEALQADLPKVLALVCGDDVKKVSQVPDDQAKIKKVIAGIAEMTAKNPFKRDADI